MLIELCVNNIKVLKYPLRRLTLTGVTMPHGHQTAVMLLPMMLLRMCTDYKTCHKGEAMYTVGGRGGNNNALYSDASTHKYIN